MVSLSRRHILLLALPVAALLVVAGQRIAGRSTQDGQGVGAPLVAASGGAADRVEVVVHVSGAVARPGLYRVREGARVADVVARAGGLKPRADLALLNLAAPLADGQHVIVPRRVATTATTEGGRGSVGGGMVQLSVATIEELDELPGIGPVTAQKIVDWREAHGAFRSVDDLDAIPGIGPARVEQLRDLVVP